ncbi:MAG: assimilatory sulfite reductase (NADPH) hemoprotein subunit [Pseudomonadales bacterium]|nr:assimilatory sulfite reductase (NADPH) hemoprotein subunit [Pseudomonadales bacterium]
MTDKTSKKLTEVEGIKARSNYLRGTLVQSLADSTTGSLAEDDAQLSKLHGFYQQDDRDIRSERTRQKLEPDFSFLIRIRVPGGIASPAQWIALDELSRKYANSSLRLTTRQAFQFHGVRKVNLKTTIAEINKCLLDTIAACGDVNRNVMCTPLAEKSEVHKGAYDLAIALSAHLTPQTSAYSEIWLDGKKQGKTPDVEPIYGKTYLPRKFKIGVAIPPSNDVDIFSQDLGFIAVEEKGKLVGFNVAVGGGMGMTHGEPETYPRVADVIGFCLPEKAVEVAEQVVCVQRDFGDRTNRKHARIKYTIDDGGLDWFNTELSERLGYSLEAPHPYKFTTRGDQFGWSKNTQGKWDLTLFIPEGRISNNAQQNLLDGFRDIAKLNIGDFRLTANQNLVIAGIGDEERKPVEKILQKSGIGKAQNISLLRKDMLACVALPTCGLAMAEAERYAPELSAKIAALLETHGLANEPVSLRITGCPNGCARPYLADIGLVGKAPGRYSLFLGGSSDGRRLNKLADENVGEPEILKILDDLFVRFIAERETNENMGDFFDRVVVSQAQSDNAQLQATEAG